MNIFRVAHQWATRPADERFPSVQSMRDQCFDYAQHAAEAETPWADLRVEASEKDLLLSGKAGRLAVVSHWAFGQLTERAGAPTPYLRSLPATLAAQNLNYGLAKRTDRTTAKVLFHSNENLVARAVTGDVYERIWNYEVCDRLLDLEAAGWKPSLPRPDLVLDGVATSNTPDLYASDHDMFAFLCYQDVDIAEAGQEYPLKRGFIVTNSEVGDCSLAIMRFLYRFQCGNHIIWEAEDMDELRLAHRGERVRGRFANFIAQATSYVNGAASEDEARIRTAQQLVIAGDKDAVLDKLFGIKRIGLPRKVLAAGYDAVVPTEDGSPNSVWGFVQGLTRFSQTIPYADQRTEIDRGAGRILKITF